MKKHIAEDLPARKHPQAQLSTPSKSDGNRPSADRDDKNETGEKTPEQKVRQAVYDIRYRARRENLPLRSAYSQYMQNSSMGEAEKAEVRKKLFGKEGNATQAENYEMDMKVSASNSVAKALYKVFVEKKDNIIDIENLKNQLEESANETASGKKYKVRVSDKESGVTYTRYATREKISQLRAKGLEVEMTEYGTPYEGERTKGEKTSEVLGKKAKRDYDHDGKVESGAKEYRGAVHNAIQRKKGGVPDGRDTSSVKEEFIGEVTTTQSNSLQSANPDTNPTQIDFTTKKNKITVNPTDSSQTKLMSHHEILGNVIAENGYSKFLKKVHSLQEKAESEQQQKLFGLALSVKRGQTSRSEVSAEVLKIVDSMSEKEIRKFAKTSHEGIPKKKIQKEEAECEMNKKKVDTRGDYAKINLIKNRLRAVGAKNPIVMITPEETVDESLAGLAVKAGLAAGTALAGKAVYDRAKGVADKLNQRNQQTKKAIDSLRNSYEPDGEMIEEEMPKRVKGKKPEGTTTFTHRGGPYGRTQSQKKGKMKSIFPSPKSDDDYDDYDDHPSLTARERNPNLR
jgi:hypothetical protein